MKHYWQLDEPFPAKPARTLAERVSRLGELSQFAAVMEEPTNDILEEFQEQPLKGLHIIVQKPPGKSYMDLYIVKCPTNVVLMSTFPNYLNRTLTMPPSTRCFSTCENWLFASISSMSPFILLLGLAFAFIAFGTDHNIYSASNNVIYSFRWLPNAIRSPLWTTSRP